MRRIMTDRPNSVHTQFIRRKIVPLALLVALAVVAVPLVAIYSSVTKLPATPSG